MRVVRKISKTYLQRERSCKADGVEKSAIFASSANGGGGVPCPALTVMASRPDMAQFLGIRRVNMLPSARGLYLLT